MLSTIAAMRLLPSSIVVFIRGHRHRAARGFFGVHGKAIQPIPPDHRIIGGFLLAMAIGVAAAGAAIW